MFARVTGFPLIGLFNKRAILSVRVGPCTSLVLEIVLPSVVGGTTNDLVYDLR